MSFLDPEADGTRKSGIALQQGKAQIKNGKSFRIVRVTRCCKTREMLNNCHGKGKKGTFDRGTEIGNREMTSNWTKVDLDEILGRNSSL